MKRLKKTKKELQAQIARVSGDGPGRKSDPSECQRYQMERRREGDFIEQYSANRFGNLNWNDGIHEWRRKRHRSRDNFYIRYLHWASLEIPYLSIIKEK